MLRPRHNKCAPSDQIVTKMFCTVLYTKHQTQHSDRQKVLCPGAGLGRLVLEIAGRGYAAQGNEFSYFMLLASNYLLNQ